MSQIDAIVIGSGFGGAMAAWPLVHAGWRVLMLERGGWVQRGPQRIIGVAGAPGGDPTEPWRSAPYPQTVPPLLRTSCRIAHHRYTARDRAARAALIHAARAVLYEAGAVVTVTRNIRTFSHGLGTVRMGVRPDSSPLDEDCRYRGADNLYVIGASALPTAGGVNPSLTIAALALRAGCLLTGSPATALHRSVRHTIIPEVIHA